MLAIIYQLIGPDKVGGWARSAVGALLLLVIVKWPGLGAILNPDTQTAIAGLVATIAVGLWSQLSKSDNAKVAMVDELAKDPVSPVKGVVLEPTNAGLKMAQAVNGTTASAPGNTTAIAGTVAAQSISKGQSLSPTGGKIP